MENNNLSLKELSLISKKVKKREKDYAKSYLLTFLLGWTGANWLYLENKVLAGLRIALTLLTTIAILIIFNVINFNINPLIPLIAVLINIPVTITELLVIDKVISDMNLNNERSITKKLCKSDIK